MGTIVKCWAISVGLLALPPSVDAAENEAAVGYASMVVRDGSIMPFGWFASFAHQVNGHGLWTVVSGSGHHRWDSRLFTIGAGARLSSTGRGPRVFGQLLAGLMSASDQHSYLAFILDPGAGVDVPLRGRTSLRLSASLPTVLGAELSGPSIVRIQLGLTLPLGTK